MPKKLRIYQISEGYCYNSDTLFLWDFLRTYLRSNARVLDIGSGSGILGLLCARESRIKLFGIEKQKEYVLLSTKNALINQLEACFIFGECELLLSKTNMESFSINRSIGLDNIIKNNAKPRLKSDEYILSSQSISTKCLWQSFDVVISNPPFYNSCMTHSQNRLKAEARQNNFLPLDMLLSCANRMLKPNGRLFFCYSALNLSLLMTLIVEHGLSVNSMRFVFSRLDRDATLVLIYARKFSMVKKNNTQVHILPPLITHVGPNQKDNSNEVIDIYSRADTYSIKVNWNDVIWDKLLDIDI